MSLKAEDIQVGHRYRIKQTIVKVLEIRPGVNVSVAENLSGAERSPPISNYRVRYSENGEDGSKGEMDLAAFATVVDHA